LLPCNAAIFQRIYSYAKCFTVIMKFIPNLWIPCGPVPVHHNKELTGLWLTKNCIELAGISSPECDAMSANSDLSIECVSTCTSFLLQHCPGWWYNYRPYPKVQRRPACSSAMVFTKKGRERDRGRKKKDNRKVEK
jgi:hypothetical protein